MSQKAAESDGTVDAATTEEVTDFLETFFKLYPAATDKELSYYVAGNALKPVNTDYLYSELINPLFTMDGDKVKVSVSVKYLDQRTKAAQISQFDLVLTGNRWELENSNVTIILEVLGAQIEIKNFGFS